MRSAAWAVVVAFVLPACAGRLRPTATTIDVGPSVEVQVAPSYRVGPVSGFLQTPRGGTPGTTSARRPTFEEVGVSHGHEPGIEVRARWRRHEVSLAASALLLHGDDTLDEPLVSQADAFAAGSHVESDTFLTFARLSWRYRFAVPLGAGDCLEVAPGLGLSGFGVNYRLRGEGGADTDRSYSTVAPHVELGLAWRPRPGQPVWFSADARHALGWALDRDGEMEWSEALVRAHYDVSRSWTAWLGTGFRHVGFEDQQTVPNHLDLDFGPWIEAGIAFRL